jgi:uncharacterized membrane protein YhaH (DUF805 family)
LNPAGNGPQKEQEMQTIFNPFGRIGPTTFRNTALVLIAIGACFSLLPWVRPDMALLSLASLLLVYPWVVIWVRRFHDAGKSGKMFLVVLALWLVAGFAANRLIVSRFVTAPPIDPKFVWASVMAQMHANAVPGTIVSVIISLAFALVINEELKSDPAENAYGPPPAR